MQIEIKYFAFFRQQTGRSRDKVNLPDSATVADLLSHLQTIWPEIKEVLDTSKISVNMEFVDLDTRLSAGDEVALIPPVSGGRINLIEADLFKITNSYPVAICGNSYGISRLISSIFSSCFTFHFRFKITIYVPA